MAGPVNAADPAAPTHSRPRRGSVGALVRLPAALARRFEAVVIGWDGLGWSDGDADVDRLRELVERLCARGLDVYVVGRGRLEEIDGRLRARPAGPGRLCLCVNLGAEVFAASAGEVTLLHRRAATAGSGRVGNTDGCGTGDATRLEVGSTDEADSVRWLLDDLRGRGIGPGLVLAAGGDVVRPGPTSRDDSPLRRGGAHRFIAVSVTPGGAPGAIALGGGPRTLLALLADQLHRREDAEVPGVDDDPAWTLAIADGRLGTRATPLLAHPAAEPGVLAAGVYAGAGADTELAPCPEWTGLRGQLAEVSALRRRLDLRTGVLRHDGPATAVAFSSLTRPGTVALRAQANADVLPPAGTRVSRAGLTAALTDLRRPDGLDRIGAYRPDETAALAAAASARDIGFDRLLVEQRQAWATRWAEADVTIEGDPDLQFALRLALFHLMASVADTAEAAVGARGLSGQGYRGHVFWDSDVFVLPFLAATHPSAARAMLEYRVNRLDAARETAEHRGCRGARFPWESAADGMDVTPAVAHLPTGELVRIRTGEAEEHIVADVAWAASCYLDWTGDRAFEAGPGRRILLETARYWASRIRLDAAGRGHIYGVIGPDEYHEPVDDNAFTNVMARWNLRRAASIGAAAIDAAGVDGAEAADWLRLAEALVDGFDPTSGLYEQFAGFFELEPLLIGEVAPRRPIAADLLLGRGRVEGAQVIKQADVLMLHHLVPDEVQADSLGANLDFYEPRTAHGSSLSPAVHAALSARAGRFREALAALRIAARIDLDDLTGTTASGVHLATMGGLWQAIVVGFAGVRPRGDVLVVDPRIPPQWNALELRLRFRGSPFMLRIDRHGVQLDAAGPLVVNRRGDSWEVRST